jgi:ABC-type lipoprotein release transport system permease subunit
MFLTMSKKTLMLTSTMGTLIVTSTFTAVCTLTVITAMTSGFWAKLRTTTMAMFTLKAARSTAAPLRWRL